ncbi:IS66 family insertion sequence element accessory protein TnpA [Flavobacterium sp. ZS1P14]|uniref:IS66 family insertion sequence element accessory protein TnpA n=1 Tax=Flavobacterium sp. ZS1P14 TaxID=3401729 RepID=UPI003AAD8381
MNQQEQMYTLVEQWRESGSSKSKFCREQHISFHQFNYWLKKMELRSIHTNKRFAIL